MKKNIQWILVFVLLCSFAYAAPPQQSDVGLTIEYPQYESTKINEPFYLHTHVVDSTTGLMVDNSTVSCFIHIYKENGQHALQENLSFDSNGIDFKLDIGAGNFTELGRHAYIIQCENGVKGGFVSGIFEVAPDYDAEAYDGTANLPIFLFLIIIVGVLMYFAGTRKTDNYFADNVIKRGLWAITFYLLTMLSVILEEMALHSGMHLKYFFFTLMYIFGAAGYLALLYLIIGGIIDLLKYSKEQALNKRMGKNDY